MKNNIYEVKDIVTGAVYEGLPANAVTALTGCSSKYIINYARTGFLCNKRYKIAIAGKKEYTIPEICKKWDDMRKAFMAVKDGTGHIVRTKDGRFYTKID